MILPRHVGFIMDGNRRWAKKLSNMITMWHESGSETLEKIIALVVDNKIEYASFWALSKENILERSQVEIQAIYHLIRHKIPKLVTSFLANNLRFEVMGDMSLLPEDIAKILFDAQSQTKKMTGTCIIIAIAYSGQDEIIRGIKKLIDSKVDSSSLDEKSFLSFLDSGKFPPIDLIVRTWGNIRHSWFFLYQSAYAEYFFTQTLWPDFGKQDFDKAILYYQQIARNFWK
jgi:undecaprenyl diphosphate synthase